MCRLFGFRSVIPSQVHRSLLAAENALGVQSNQHRDGWGVAFYVDGSPHVTRSPLTAVGDARLMAGGREKSDRSGFHSKSTYTMAAVMMELKNATLRMFFMYATPGRRPR